MFGLCLGGRTAAAAAAAAAAASALWRALVDSCLGSTVFVLKAVPHAVGCQGNHTNKARLPVN